MIFLFVLDILIITKIFIIFCKNVIKIWIKSLSTMYYDDFLKEQSIYWLKLKILNFSLLNIKYFYWLLRILWLISCDYKWSLIFQHYNKKIKRSWSQIKLNQVIKSFNLLDLSSDPGFKKRKLSSRLIIWVISFNIQER